MNNTEQQQRLREIQEQQEHHSKQFDGHGHHFGRADIRKMLNSVDFLLSLVKSQESDDDTGVDTIMSGLEARLLDSAEIAINKAIDAATTSMRSACVEKVKELRDEYKSLEHDACASALEDAAQQLQSVTLQDHETKQTPQAGKAAP